MKEKHKKQQKPNKDRKEQGETEAVMKGWELNDFVLLTFYYWLVHLYKIYNMA